VPSLGEDGLWVCQNCSAKLVLPTAGKEAGELVEELRTPGGTVHIEPRSFFVACGLTLAAADAEIWGGWWVVVGRGGRAGGRAAPRARLSSNR
jgi:hypothetical protein